MLGAMRWLSRRSWLKGLCVGVAMGACTTDALPPVERPAPPFRHQTFADTLAQDAEAFTRRGGDWLEDYGDAPFYGLAYYAYTAPSSATTLEARDRAVSNITDVDFFNSDLQEVTMSALGLIAYVDATGDRSVVPALDLFIDALDDLVGNVAGYYIYPGLVDSWALRTYGSTSISALLALINAEYAIRVGGERADARAAFAKVAGDKIAEVAYTGTGWAFGPDDDRLYLYPNVAMILLDGRLFQLTGDARHRERAVAAHQAIQALKLADAPTRYASPYSAEAMGAQTDDYSTLSSHNYLMLALAVLFEITNEPDYVVELDHVLDAMETQLYGAWCLSDVHPAACTPTCETESVCVADSCAADSCGHAVLHHWMDGRPAIADDPEFMCTGCNLQLLYVLWYRQRL